MQHLYSCTHCFVGLRAHGSVVLKFLLQYVCMKCIYTQIPTLYSCIAILKITVTDLATDAQLKLISLK